MKSLSKIEKVRVPEYIHLISRIVFALVIAIIIQTFNNNIRISHLLVNRDYYISLGLHFLISIIIIEIINRITGDLDKKFFWLASPYKRLLLQVFFGILIPTASGIIIVKAFLCPANDNVINHLSQMDYFIIIFSLVLFINAYYIVHYISKIIILSAVRKNNKAAKSKKNKSTRRKPESNKGQVLDFPVKDIALIMIKEDGCFVITSENEKLIWPYSLENTMGQLPLNEYFLINRSAIVNIDNIHKVKHLTSRRIQLILNSPDNEVVFVSQRQSSNFKSWLAENKTSIN